MREITPLQGTFYGTSSIDEVDVGEEELLEINT